MSHPYFIARYQGNDTLLLALSGRVVIIQTLVLSKSCLFRIRSGNSRLLVEVPFNQFGKHSGTKKTDYKDFDRTPFELLASILDVVHDMRCRTLSSLVRARSCDDESLAVLNGWFDNVFFDELPF